MNHRGQRAGLGIELGLGRILITLTGVLVAGAATWVGQQLDRLDQRSDQLGDTINEKAGQFAGDLDATTADLRERSRERAQDIDDLARRLRALQAETGQAPPEPDRPAPKPGKRPAAARQTTPRPSVTPTPVRTSQPPRDPQIDALCQALKVQCSPPKEPS